MSSFALKRSLAVNLEATMSPAGPPENPLEEFAGLMGVDVSALERFDGAGDFVQISGPSHEPASAEIDGSPKPREDETSVHGFSLLSEATHRTGLYRSAEAPIAEAPPTPRRSRALTLGVLVAVGVAGCLGAWALKGAPDPQRTSTMEADDPIKVLPTEQEAAALRDESASSLPGNQTSEPGPVNLESIEKQPPVFEEQTKSPTTTLSVAAAPILTEAAPSAMPAATPASVSAAPPVTRSIALLASASGQAQAPASTVALRTAPTVNPEPKPMKTVSAHFDGSVLPNDNGTPAGANNSPPPSASRTPPAPSDRVPPLLNPPTPIARPSVDASAGGALKPVKERLDAPAKLSANSVVTEPVARTASIAPNAQPPANVAADPNGGDFSAKSVLQFVPNLYEKAAGALRGSPPETPVAPTGPAPLPTATVAAAPSGGGLSAESVLQFVPNLYEKAAGALRGSPPATQIARADPNPTTAGDGGAYGLQFGAPTTEPAARKASARLQSKFAIELGGLEPTVRQAEVHGRKLYQVSIGGMSKADAEALCLKLRSSGGEVACSVASN
jgi:hypothetical protein